MKTKEKRCSGTGLAKGYGCGKMTSHRVYGLGKMCCYSDWLLNSENGKIKLEKARITGKKKVEKEVKSKHRKEKIELKEKNKTITQLINEAKKPFQKWIRYRDANESCISCGSTTAEIWDGGHFYKAEVYRGLIFDERNVHKQCRKCNGYLGGNENNYRLGLIKRYGEDFVKSLDDISNENRTHKYTREEIKEIKQKYQTKNLQNRFTNN